MGKTRYIIRHAERGLCGETFPSLPMCLDALKKAARGRLNPAWCTTCDAEAWTAQIGHIPCTTPAPTDQDRTAKCPGQRHVVTGLDPTLFLVHAIEGDDERPLNASELLQVLQYERRVEKGRWVS